MKNDIFLVVFLLYEYVAFVGTFEFNIEGVFHEDWCPFKLQNNLSSSSCFTQCYNACVTYQFNVFKTTEFQRKLYSVLTVQNTSLEKVDVIIVGEPNTDVEDGVSLNKRLSILTSPYNSATANNSYVNNSASDLVKDKHTQGLDQDLKKFISRLFGALKHITVIVFHDEATGLYAGDLLDYLGGQGVGVGVLVYALTEKQTSLNLGQILTFIHERYYTRGIYALLFGTSHTVLRTLKVVNSFDVQSNRTTNFRHLSHWLVLTDLDNPELYLPVVDRLENVAIVDIHSHIRPILNIQHVLDYLQATVNRYFDLSSQEIICSSPNTLKRNLTHLIENAMSPQRDQLTVLALHGVGNFSRFDTGLLDDEMDGVQIQNIIFPNKKYKWNGVHVLVSTKPWPGYVEKVTNGNQTRYEGMCIELLKSMASALNFTYTIEDVPDGEWGTIVHGSWTGLIRQLQDRVIDLALADITIHSSRDSVMDFIYPAFKSEVIDILYRLHDDSDINMERLTTPLKPVLLPIVAGSLCAITILYVVVEYAEELVKLRRQPLFIAVVFWKAVWHLIGSFLSQGGSESPRSCSGRLLMASWWLFCIIFAAMYSATLTVSFCVQRTVVPFTSLHDMVYSSDYKWGMFNGSINMNIFGTSKNPLYKATYNQMMEFAKSDPDVLSKDMDSQLNKVVNDKYAFISSRVSLNVMVQRAPKGVTLTTLGERLNPSGAALGVPTDSPLLPEFEWVMRNLRETGILQFWVGQFWNRSQPRPNNFQLGGDPLPLQKLLNAFCIVAFGVSLALTVLLCETLLKCLYTKAKVNQTSRYSCK